MRKKIIIACIILVIILIALISWWLLCADTLQKTTKDEISNAVTCVLEQNEISTRLDKKQLSDLKLQLLSPWDLDVLYNQKKKPSIYLVFDNLTLGLIEWNENTYIKVLNHAGKYFRTDHSVYLTISQMIDKKVENQAVEFEKAVVSEKEASILWEDYIWNAYLDLPDFENSTDLYSAQLLNCVYDYMLLRDPDHIFFYEDTSFGVDVTVYLPEHQVITCLKTLFNVTQLPEDGTIFKESYQGVTCYALYHADLPAQRKNQIIPQDYKKEDGKLKLLEFRIQEDNLVAVAIEYDTVKNTEICTVYFTLVKREDGAFYLRKLEKTMEIPDGISMTGSFQSVGTVGGRDYYELPENMGKAVQIENKLIIAEDDGYKIKLGAVNLTSNDDEGGTSVNLLPGESLLRYAKKGNLIALLTNQRVIAMDIDLKANRIIKLPAQVTQQYDIDDNFNTLMYIDQDGLWNLSLATDELTQIYKQPYQYEIEGAPQYMIEKPRFVNQSKDVLCEYMLAGQAQGYYLFDSEGGEELYLIPRGGRDIGLISDKMVVVINGSSGEGKLLAFESRNIMGFSIPVTGLISDSLVLGERYLMYFAALGKGSVLKMAEVSDNEIKNAKATNFGVLNAETRLYGVSVNGRALCGYGNLGKYDILLTDETKRAKT